MVHDPHPRLSSSDKEDLSDLRLILMTAEGNARAAGLGEDVVQALANVEIQVEQAARIVARLRERFPG
jgi:hypothetical protein